MNDPPHTRNLFWPLLWPVFALSCGILGYEIALMRVLLYASWHHFAFLVISVALLGFGASGTVLCFLRPWLIKKGTSAIFSLVVLTAVSIPVSLQLAQAIPVEARVVPALLAKQLLLWTLYWAILAIPFLLGAMALGLALVLAGSRVSVVYSANLTGSAVGVALATGLMFWVAPAWLASVLGVVVLAGALGAMRGKRQLSIMTAAVLVTTILMVLVPPRVRVDPYKYLSYVHRLERADNATPVARVYGPRSVVEVFSSPAFHDLPFLSVGENPPTMKSITLDGQPGGSLLNATTKDEARIVDRTLMAFPYQFAAADPSVLLLGETGGANIWLAARNNASTIHVAQPNGQLVDLLTSELRDEGGVAFALPNVTVHRSTPRHVIDHVQGHFDLIQLVSLESWAVETGGIAGLNQDYLVTIEGLANALEHLAPDGILTVGRGIQIPPRDNIKLLNTLIRALGRVGLREPQKHVVMVRDYLAVCTMIKRSPWTRNEIEQLRMQIAERELTPVYFPGVREDELNHPDELPGPADAAGDWLSYAVAHLLSAEADDFIDEWAFDIRAPTDDRPFFGNFTKLDAIGEFRRAFGDLWLTRTELALLFVLAAAGVIAIVALVALVLPLLTVRDIRYSRGIGSVTVFFLAIGLAYLLLEITMLSRLIRLMGDPVLAGAATITGFLLFSGVGALIAQRISRPGVLARLMIALVVVGILEVWLAGTLAAAAQTSNDGVRFILATAMIAPLGFLMGFPMPVALRRLNAGAPQLIPWAWGVNGFASVIAPPLATVIGMTMGFSWAGITALVCYAIAAGAFGFLYRSAQPRG